MRRVPAIKIGHYILGELDKFGDAGWLTTKKLLTSIRYWKDLQSIEPDRKLKAEKSLAALVRACDAYFREQAFQERQEREQREKEMHQKRVDRSAISALDHKLLQSLRDEFDEIYLMTDTQTFALRGIHSLGMLAALPEKELIARMGQEGKRLRQLASGVLPHLFQPIDVPFVLESVPISTFPWKTSNPCSLVSPPCSNNSSCG